MDELIKDVTDIFLQILQIVAPNRVGDYAFQLTCYICSSVLIALMCLAFFNLCCYVVKYVIRRFGGA